MRKIVVLFAMIMLVGCSGNAQQKKEEEAKPKFPLERTDAEWKKILTPEQYFVLRQKGTEKPFNNKYDKFYKDGVYVCAADSTKLFLSEHKYDSGSGWPAFDTAIRKDIYIAKDNSYGLSRDEVLCATCGGHLGHVFDDGPINTTGIRYCINSAALQFIPKDDESILEKK
ncbi:peptide-methionine (R)-S-oxide reductase MsrB [Aureivirga sp. CE67]|uniref:peptide-methionine (R)-S-oxide reductase MsrB n=1 Tax=Aureivirga sp. CE67 TaxID=1788983 RepID=UPI0018CB0CD3|nr:peptide-methionine (R)-S-oxide reductase MsrB [Aureivirga sp. CE67]